MTRRSRSSLLALLFVGLSTACAGSDTPSNAARIDLRVVFDNTDDDTQALFRLEDRAQHAGTVDTDGIMAIEVAATTLSSATASRATCVASPNIPTARRFHADHAATGLADAATLNSGELLVDRFHADQLGVTVGDHVEVASTAGSATATATVVAVVDDISIAGYCGGIVARTDLPDDYSRHLLISLRDGDSDGDRDGDGDTSATRRALAGLLTDVGRPELTVEDASMWNRQDPTSPCNNSQESSNQSTTSCGADNGTS